MTQATKKPHLLKGDMYSNNLRLWLKKRAAYGVPTVYRDTENGRYFICYAEDADYGELYGAWVSRIMTHGSAEHTTLPMSGDRARPLKKVPHFWEMYADKGICLLDPEHGAYTRQRWEAVKPEEPQASERQKRVCKFCGLTQFKYTWEEVVVETHSSWK